MTCPQLSAEEQKRAEQIYKRTLWTLRVVSAVLWLSVYGGVCLAFPDLYGLISGAVSGSLFSIYFLVPSAFARAHLRKEGLSLEHTERRLIWQGAPVQMESLDFKGEGQLNGSPLRFLVTWILLFLMLIGIFAHVPVLDSQFNTMGKVFIAFLLSAALMNIYGLWENKLSLLRLNEKGVSSTRNFFWRRTVPWSNIADVEETRTWDYKGEEQHIRVSFRNAKGKALFRVLSTPGGSFVSELEACLHGDKISSA